MTLYWNGEEFALEQSDDLRPGPLGWEAVPDGAVSPVAISCADLLRPMRFYRLRLQ